MPPIAIMNPHSKTLVWSCEQVKSDLVQQGGLNEQSLTTRFSGAVNTTFGTREGNRFSVTWNGKKQLLLSMMDGFDQSLVDAFSTILGFKPFVRYESSDYETVEWSDNPDEEWELLKNRREDWCRNPQRL